MKKVLGFIVLGVLFIASLHITRIFLQQKKDAETFNSHVDEFNACSELRHWKCAEKNLDFLLKELPNDTNLQMHYAGILFEQGRYEECISYIESRNFHSADFDFLIEKSKFLIRERDELGIQNFGHFRLELEDYADPIEVQEALSVLEIAYDSLANLFQFYPENTILVVMYQSKDFQGVGDHPDWVGAVYDGKIRIPANLMHYRAIYRPILFHELTHAFVHQMTRAKIPQWLNEGIAQVIDGSRSGLPQPTGPVPSLKALTESFTKYSDRTTVERLYWYSQKMVETLLSNAQDDRFVKLRNVFVDLQKSSVDDALTRHFCKKQGDLLYNFVERK